MNPALRFTLWAAFALLLAWGVTFAGLLGMGSGSDFSARNLAPSLAHPFGSDHMGRDLFIRSLAGLSISLWVGLAASGFSTLIALGLALLAALGRRADAFTTFLTDVMLALPHLMVLVLLAFAFGSGAGAVILAVALSHWPKLARILRAEVHRLLAAPYVEASRGFGTSPFALFWRHLLPHLLPQALVGFTLTFPHAVLHEAGLTFLGFGLDPSRPAIGVMLSEALAHLSAGRWWLAFFPGAMLLVMALVFEGLGQALHKMIGGRSC